METPRITRVQTARNSVGYNSFATQERMVQQYNPIWSNLARWMLGYTCDETSIVSQITCIIPHVKKGNFLLATVRTPQLASLARVKTRESWKKKQEPECLHSLVVYALRTESWEEISWSVKEFSRCFACCWRFWMCHSGLQSNKSPTISSQTTL